MNNEYEARPWMKRVLLAAGIYNLVWGAACVFSPTFVLNTLGVEVAPVVIQLWQCIGMIVGVYGVGYLIASRNPFRHWSIVVVGLLGKMLGPVGFFYAVWQQTLPVSMSWTIVTNDLIWWIPFGMILWGVIRSYHTEGSAYTLPEADAPLHDVRSTDGQRLDDLANDSPQLVMFLRHAGCTFCREALSDLSKQRRQIEAAGCGIVIVHLGANASEDEQFFRKYSLDDLPRFSDPACRLYRQFGLDLGGFSELFGFRVWVRGVIAGLLNGHGIGAIRGNSFQMPGVYLYHRGQIVGGFRHSHASDRPDYLALAQQATPQPELAAAL